MRCSHIRFRQMNYHLSHRWTRLNKTPLCLSCYFQEFIKQHLWLPILTVQYSCEASLYRSFTSPFCNCPHQSDCKGATRGKHAHTHTSMSQPWYVRHASTTPENDLYPFSGLSLPQWCSPSGAHILWNSSPATTCKLVSTALYVLGQGKEHVWTMLMRPDHCVQSWVYQGCRSPHYSLMWDAQIRWSS